MQAKVWMRVTVMTLQVCGVCFCLRAVFCNSTLYHVISQATNDVDDFLRAHTTKEEKVLVIDTNAPSRQTSSPCP